jgi:hypothetical protein
MKTMNTMQKFMLTIVSVAAFSVGTAQASLIDLGLFSLNGPLGSPQDEADWIESVIPLGYDLIYLEKYNYGTGFDGTGAAPDSGQADYTVDPTIQGPNADITWDLTGTGFTASYVLVKDGVDAGKHLYRLYDVTDDQATVGSDDVTINNDKNISHIAWYGQRDSGGGVPDGGATVALLGFGMVAVGYLRRRMA